MIPVHTHTHTRTSVRGAGRGSRGNQVWPCTASQPARFWTQLHLAGSRFFILFMCCRSLSSAGPSPHSFPPSLPDCLARCFLLVFLSLSASRYKIKYLSLFFMANSLAESGHEGAGWRRGSSVWAWTCAHVCMYVQLGHKPSAISA